MDKRERLRDVALIQQNADKAVEKFFHRAPFMWGVMLTLLAATVAGATWTTTIQLKLSQHADYINTLQSDGGTGILEQIHANSKAAERNRKQINRLNTKEFGIPDPGE
jgi:hypothetical protein